jgi:hypothetical protein
MILEIDLYDFVRKSEHNGVFGAHPFLDVDRTAGGRRGLLLLVLRHALEVTLEVLQQRHFFVQVFGLVFECLLVAGVVFF